MEIIISFRDEEENIIVDDVVLKILFNPLNEGPGMIDPITMMTSHNGENTNIKPQTIQMRELARSEHKIVV